MSKSDRAMVSLKIETKERHAKLRGELTQDHFENRLLDLWQAHNSIEREIEITEFRNRKESE